MLFTGKRKIHENPLSLVPDKPFFLSGFIFCFIGVHHGPRYQGTGLKTNGWKAQGTAKKVK